MTDSCRCPPEAETIVCDLPAQDLQRPACAVNTCPKCGKMGKPVQGQTIKSMLSVSLREVEDLLYLFCRTHTCPVVYFSAHGEKTFTIEQVRERVYQKEPEAQDVLICYCFRHNVGELQLASPAERRAILENINTEINAGQCACDLRNPQGSCCLGNIRTLLKRLAPSAAERMR